MPSPATHNLRTGRRKTAAQVRTPPLPITVREYQDLTGLLEDEKRDLERFALERASEEKGERQASVLTLQQGKLRTQNYVGIIETRQGRVIEILPKVDLSQGETGEHEETRRVFMNMLRDWRRLGETPWNDAGIRDIRRFDMLEAFIHLFLTNVVLLTRRGLARAYRTQEANLACLRGRILFPQHIRENLVDRSRFYVGFDEFTADRPANRLIHCALQRLMGVARHPANRQRLHQLRILFSSVPLSTNPNADWARHQVDRSMRQYDAVMPWVRLFLFGHGLATFAGSHVNRALLFPMQEVFEDFVTAALRRHQQDFAVHSQGTGQHLATDDRGNPSFSLKPDIILREGKQDRFILDAKWKQLNPSEPNYGVKQPDVYQLFAYGRQYDCRRVALIYPQTAAFHKTLRFRFQDEPALELACFPFNVEDPEETVGAMIKELLR